jgi:SAM-dependent methyltransferase
MHSSQALSFDSSAEEYDRYRPGYPDALFDDLFAISGLSALSRVLEIGSGSGIASLPIAKRVSTFVGLEPGAELARIARSRLEGLNNCEIFESTFEQSTIESGRYHLVYSAQAFHWLDSATRFERVADALVAEGALAIFGNATLGARPETQAKFDRIYSKHAPELSGASPTTWYLPDGPVRELIGESGLFEEARVRSYPWARRYSASDYLALLGTHSDHALLAD